MRFFATMVMVIAVSACESIEVHGEGPGRALYSTIVGQVEMTSPGLENALDMRLAALDAQLRVIALEIATLPETNVDVSASLDPFFLKKEIFEAYLIELIEAMPPGITERELEAILRSVFGDGLYGEISIANADSLIDEFMRALCKAVPTICQSPDKPFLTEEDLRRVIGSWQAAVEDKESGAAWLMFDQLVSEFLTQYGSEDANANLASQVSKLSEDFKRIVRYEQTHHWYYRYLRWLASNPILVLLPISIGVAIWGYQLNASHTRKKAALEIIEKSQSDPFYKTNVVTFTRFIPRVTDDGDFEKAQRLFVSLNSNLAPTELRDRIVWHLNEFEIAAIGIKNDIIDEQIYSDWIRSYYLKTWEYAEPFIHVYRQRAAEPNTPGYKEQVFCEFEALVRKWGGTIRYTKENWEKGTLPRHLAYDVNQLNQDCNDLIEPVLDGRRDLLPTWKINDGRPFESRTNNINKSENE